MAKNRKEYIVIDLEMTCEKPRPKGYKPEIIEIGMVFMTHDGEIKKKEQILVRPKHNSISEFCTELTGYTENVLKKEGVPYEEACRKIMKLGTQNKTIVAWGEDWNQFLMESEWKNCDYPLSNSFVNLSLIHSILLKTKEKVSLENALEFWGIEAEGTLHTGVDDAYNTALILKKMIDKFPTFE